LCVFIILVNKNSISRNYPIYHIINIFNSTYDTLLQVFIKVFSSFLKIRKTEKCKEIYNLQFLTMFFCLVFYICKDCEGNAFVVKIEQNLESFKLYIGLLCVENMKLFNIYVYGSLNLFSRITLAQHTLQLVSLQ